MASADVAIKQLFNEYLNNLHTCLPCEVVKYDKEKLEADLQPLFKRIKMGEQVDYPLLSSVPVVKSLVKCADPTGKCECGHYMELEAGQKVLAIIAERALDYVGNRRHDLRDALVIAVIE